MWWVLQTILVTSAMALLVALGGRLLKASPAALHVLWLLVLVRFIVPPVLEWPWPLLAQPADGRNVSQVIMDAFPLLPYWGDASDSLASAAANPVRAASTRENALQLPSWSVAQWLLACWATSTAVVALMQLVRLVRMHRIFKRASPAPPWMQAGVDSLSLNIRTRAPLVEVSPDMGVPVYWNLDRPRLIVPQRLVDSLDRDGWLSIFVHELAHHKRRDHWVGWLELIVGCVWWWNPVFWYARRRLRESAEMACDAWVVSELPEHRRAYADALLHVFESVSQRADRRLAWSMSADIRLGFERRLRMIYASNGSRTVSRVGLAAAAVLFIAVTPGWTVEETAPAAGPATLPAADGPVDASESASLPVTERGPVDIALDDARVNIEFESEHISRIAGFVAEYVGVNIVLDTRVIAPLPGKSDTIYHADYVTDGLVRYINLEDVALRDALRALCRPLDLTFEARPGFIWISSPELIGSESWPELPAETEGKEALEASVSIEFEDEHLSRILDFVSQYVGVNLVLDTRVVAPAADLPPGSPAPAGAPGVPGGPVPPDTAGQPASSPAVAVAAADDRYVTSGVVPYLKLTNIPLHEALLALLRPMNLTYRVEHGYIWISTPEIMKNEPAG